MTASRDDVDGYRSMTRRPSATLRCAQVREHREDAAVGVFAFGHVEFHEDVADVGLDRALADHEFDTARRREQVGERLASALAD